MDNSVTSLPLRNLPKHDRYADAYERYGFFWGLGVEHETYVATSQSRVITSFKGILTRERYSVSYYDAYVAGTYKSVMDRILDICGGSLTIPILMNSHSFTRCDVSGEHATLYSKTYKPNPKYGGVTLYEYLCGHSPWLLAEMDKAYMWDGDTVEFMTQRFYKATVASVMEELEEIESRFVTEVARAPAIGLLETHGPLRLASPVNEPWVTYMTNPANVSMFNNGTIHINVTLPTRLGFNRCPLWPADFLEKHRRLARLVQWFEPLWIACHGSPDPFAAVSDRYALGSQRLAVSRYIGVGTFDTNTMPVGKILQAHKLSLGPLPWYDRLYAVTDYSQRDTIGLDINYNKHWAHGLELRFLDQLPFAALRSVLEQIVVLMDVSLESGSIPDPRVSVVWQNMAYEALHRGSAWSVSVVQMAALCSVLGIRGQPKEPLDPRGAIAWLFEQLEGRKAFCWTNMMPSDRSISPRSRCRWIS
jgi:hypothetical protein